MNSDFEKIKQTIFALSRFINMFEEESKFSSIEICTGLIMYCVIFLHSGVDDDKKHETVESMTKMMLQYSMELLKEKENGTDTTQTTYEEEI